MRGRVDVEVIDFKGATGERAQLECYEDCCRRFRDTHQWIAFLDSDEYLAVPEGRSISDVVATMFFPSGVAFNWACFGSNGHVAMPQALTIEAYTRRSHAAFDSNVHTKMMVRPDRVTAVVNPHFFRLEGAIVRPDGKPVGWRSDGLTSEVIYDGWKINHYFVRSQAHWARKLARGYRDSTVRAADMFAAYDLNDVEDHSASRLGPAVRQLVTPPPPTAKRSLWAQLGRLFTRAKVSDI